MARITWVSDLTYVATWHGFAYHRLLGPTGHLPPAEYEEIYYKQLEARSEPARLN